MGNSTLNSAEGTAGFRLGQSDDLSFTDLIQELLVQTGTEHGVCGDLSGARAVAAEHVARVTRVGQLAKRGLCNRRAHHESLTEVEEQRWSERTHRGTEVVRTGTPRDRGGQNEHIKGQMWSERPHRGTEVVRTDTSMDRDG